MRAPRRHELKRASSKLAWAERADRIVAEAEGLDRDAHRVGVELAVAVDVVVERRSRTSPAGRSPIDRGDDAGGGVDAHALHGLAHPRVGLVVDARSMIGA